MSLEITCMLVVSYIFMFGEFSYPYFLKNYYILRLALIVVPKIISVLILYHTVTKYVLKPK